MFTFIVSILLLILGYFTYGKFVEKIFGARDNEQDTPSHTENDGVDFIPLKKQKNAFIQLLNIAGVGPIFGPILGALYGPVAFLWIVLGCIFAGGVHDYLTGMISVRNKGLQLPALAAKYIGKPFSHLVNLFALLLLLLVGTVFVVAPSEMISELLDGSQQTLMLITAAIFLYYTIATILPIDKIIGRIYPFLGAMLLLSALGIGIGIFFSSNSIPEIDFENLHPDNIPYYPLIFLTISCGALSGFHATQSPIISRTLNNEKDGRYVFYGMMIAEGVIAMVWAAAAMTITDQQEIYQLIQDGGPGLVVNHLATIILGSIGGTIAVIGIIVLPITSGDTSFRAARMIVAEYIKRPQKELKNRFMIAIPIFAVSFLLLTVVDFDMLWRYFSWANQVTAAIALWTGTAYLYRQGNYYWIPLVPAVFITSVVITYIFYDSDLGFGLGMTLSKWIGIGFALFCAILLHLGSDIKKHINFSSK
ncbi:carbon starvation CstA family protein [Zunongwangia profunda]|jgi:carbon starvation protein CstA|uniref:Carbon starvation protein CstA n=2 Tax=Zunongwangia profunda TaxID=398743 RepID=D5BC52_ZUNPS|nr:carbon starvation CstA family protein [Zunongwangia profunda]ADF54678.1 carbon starvation protein CstA [Zunongwangia profunda SM-A87]MAC63514.1 carbon starvation protein A [Flavobacteriaceae bacterium]MAS70387.1 carbon starvation protein A [Zunongwangia sp.]HCV81791.1 carbon starvation protein A [Zunongwangia profunda]|tara:strand:- start:1808 stop:3238 length:1431 start_codon:yes stop_codon:yes gene_type:complete